MTDHALHSSLRPVTKTSRLLEEKDMRPYSAFLDLRVKEEIPAPPTYQIVGNLGVGDGFGGGHNFLQDETMRELGVLAKGELKLYYLPVSSISKIADTDLAFRHMKDEVPHPSPSKEPTHWTAAKSHKLSLHPFVGLKHHASNAKHIHI